MAHDALILLIGIRIAFKAVLHQIFKQCFRLRQRDQHRTDIAHRGDMELTPQPSGAAAVVRHGDDCRNLNILNEFDAAQDDRLAMPAADNDDLQRVIVHPNPACRGVLYNSYIGSYSDHTGNS